jgi:hypothetical protein
MLADVETDFIKNHCSIKRITLDVGPDFFKPRALQTLEGLSKDILERQRSLRDIKDFIKSVESDRVRACFAPYQGKNREKQRKVPIRELKERLIGDEDNMSFFNPTVVVRLANEAPMPSFRWNTAKDDEVSKRLEDLLESLRNKGFNESIITRLKDEYKNVFYPHLFPQ